MRKTLFIVAVTALCMVVFRSRPMLSQGRGGAEWTTAHGDAQHSSWVRSDSKVSAATLQKGLPTRVSGGRLTSSSPTPTVVRQPWNGRASIRPADKSFAEWTGSTSRKRRCSAERFVLTLQSDLTDRNAERQQPQDFDYATRGYPTTFPDR